MHTQNRYEKLISYLTDYIYTVTINDGIVTDTVHGPGCVSVTGYTQKDYKKDPDLWYRMVHSKERDKVLRQAQMALAGKEVAPVEHRITHRDGTTRWVKNTIVISKDENGRVTAYDGLINDITELKRAEAASAFRSQQLRQAEKMASLGTLVAGIAHEINNPNNFILLNTQLFSKIWKDIVPLLDEYGHANGDFCIGGMPYSQSKEKILSSLEGIAKGSERIAKITRSLTEYSKVDSDTLNEIVDVNKVVEMAVLITGNLIKNSTSNFTVEYDKFLPKIRGNAQQLEQVVVNLITNACQSLTDISAEIRINTYYDVERNKVRIIVADHGVGIKQGDMKYIMDPFFTTKRNSGGTGLGLSVSYNIIKSHRGALMVSSELNRGTIAKIFLPVPREIDSLKHLAS